MLICTATFLCLVTCPHAHLCQTLLPPLCPSSDHQPTFLWHTSMLGLCFTIRWSSTWLLNLTAPTWCLSPAKARGLYLLERKWFLILLTVSACPPLPSTAAYLSRAHCAIFQCIVFANVPPPPPPPSSLAHLWCSSQVQSLRIF